MYSSIYKTIPWLKSPASVVPAVLVQVWRGGVSQRCGCCLKTSHRGRNHSHSLQINDSWCFPFNLQPHGWWIKNVIHSQCIFKYLFKQIIAFINMQTYVLGGSIGLYYFFLIIIITFLKILFIGYYWVFSLSWIGGIEILNPAIWSHSTQM